MRVSLCACANVCVWRDRQRDRNTGRERGIDGERNTVYVCACIIKIERKCVCVCMHACVLAYVRVRVCLYDKER